jgi:hypothetical protein
MDIWTQLALAAADLLYCLGATFRSRRFSIVSFVAPPARCFFRPSLDPCGMGGTCSSSILSFPLTLVVSYHVIPSVTTNIRFVRNPFCGLPHPPAVQCRAALLPAPCHTHTSRTTSHTPSAQRVRRRRGCCIRLCTVVVFTPDSRCVHLAATIVTQQPFRPNGSGFGLLNLCPKCVQRRLGQNTVPLGDGQ